MTSVQSAANCNEVPLGRRFLRADARWKLVLAVVLAITGLALLFALFATRHYQGETRLLIESRQSIDIRTGSKRRVLGDEGVAGQVEVILSSDLLGQVASKFGLALRPEFDAEASTLSRLLAAAGLSSNPNEIPREERVLKAFRDRLSVYRVEGSRIVAIGMSSEDPELAAGIPNALADAYLAMQGTTPAHRTSGAPRRAVNFPPADARIVSHAVTPSEPYFPKVLIISGGAFAASLLAMILITLLREWISGSAMRQASRARPEPIDEVAIPQWMPFEPEETVRLPPAPVDVPMPRPATAQPARLGEIGIERAAEKLIACGAARAIFVSPEGDEAAVVAVLVAREVAGTGLRVLLLDLTATGAASRPMLDTVGCAGITDLLTSEAQFTDVIHQDNYSDCHVIPVGTAEPARAMRAADRLPIIMDSLTTAYDLVVVECGPADAEGIRRLATDGTQILLSLIDAETEAAAAAQRLKDAGCPGLTLVTQSRYQPPAARMRDRSAA